MKAAAPPAVAPPETAWTLIFTLQNTNDSLVWRRFIGFYGGMAQRWLRGWGLQPADAEDVWQLVLLDAFKGIKGYRPRQGCRFRSWLKKLAWHAMIRFCKKRGREVPGSGSTSVQLALQMFPDYRDTTKPIVRTEGKLGVAMQRVQHTVSAREWQAFTLFHFDGLKGAEIARKLGMTVASIHSACSKVRGQLRQQKSTPSHH